MEGVENRKARFICVLAFAAPDLETMTVEGVCEGQITTEPRGDNGFGYDPIFLVDGKEKTMAQLEQFEKKRNQPSCKSFEETRKINRRLGRG